MTLWHILVTPKFKGKHWLRILNEVPAPHSEESLWLFRGGVSDLFSEDTNFEYLPSH